MHFIPQPQFIEMACMNTPEFLNQIVILSQNKMQLQLGIGDFEFKSRKSQNKTNLGVHFSLLATCFIENKLNDLQCYGCAHCTLHWVWTECALRC